MDAELTIYEDCLHLIDIFAKKENANFKTFCELWKCMTFQHIYSAQTTAVEIIQTTKTILHLCKRIVCAKDELGKIMSNFKDNKHIFRRIGGFFLMYSIYFLQPTKEYVKLLVSKKTWEDMSSFIENLPQNGLTDEVRYMFWVLYKNDAFVFTALDYEVGLEDLIEYDLLCDVHQGNNTKEVVRVKLKQKITAIDETNEILPEMISNEENYNKSKNSLIRYNRTVNILPKTTIFQDIQNVMKSIHDILDEDQSQESMTETENEISYDSKKKELKRKASGRFNNEESEPEKSTANISAKDEIGRYCGRLTVRQMMTRKLPQELLDDLKNSSEDEEAMDEIEFIENSE